MFQTFGATSAPEQGPPRLQALRGQIAESGLSGFLIPRVDAYQGEYVAPRDARLSWLTGFTGSAGFCAVLPDIAGVFIDGRYRVQVRDQVATDFTPVHWPETGLAEWLPEHLPDGGKIGFDPWLHTASEIKTLRDAVADKAITLIPTDNLIDRIWPDQPAAPDAKFTVFPLEYAGESHDEKRARIGNALVADAAIITLPDCVAWLLNIRGTDIERNPVPHAFCILEKSGHVRLFTGAGKADNVRDHLSADVEICSSDAFEDALRNLTDKVQIDPKSCPEQVRLILSDADIALTEETDPCILPKACKNETELAGSRAAHLRDGAAMAQFLAWLDVEAPKGQLTEIDVVTKLEGFRAATNALLDVSFETISGAGPHGAIVHYRVTDETNRAVKPGELLLVDSGGQYLDGTTDITRTMIVGTPTPEHRACFTRVLQGMIALSRVRFPKGVGGQHLESLARFPLWLAGQDYDHGTGHGVGTYLSVHEGPQGFSRKSTVALKEGMILSNEPGYYREGAFGIRIENLMYVVSAPTLDGADDRDMLAFETLTFVPIDRRLIKTDMLSQGERDWIDGYHADTLRQIGPRLDGPALDWLTDACAKL